MDFFRKKMLKSPKKIAPVARKNLIFGVFRAPGGALHQKIRACGANFLFLLTFGSTHQILGSAREGGRGALLTLWRASIALWRASIALWRASIESKGGLRVGSTLITATHCIRYISDACGAHDALPTI